jgi:hypothetical protein
LDEMRYYLNTRPKKLPPTPEKTALQKNKEKHVRQMARLRRAKN